MVTWNRHVEKIVSIMEELSITDKDGKNIDIDEGFRILEKKILELKKNKNSLFVIGNGACASIASHLSADLAKNGKIRTRVFTDLALLTAMANDNGYKNVFSDSMEIWSNTGDILVTISSSGNSQNIIKAIETAQNIGVFCISLSAMKKGNTSRRIGDLNIYIPAKEYGNAEVIHSMILHYLTDNMLMNMIKKNSL